MEVKHTILTEIENYITDYFDKKIPEKYFYHDLQHTLNVVNAVEEIGRGYDLEPRELELLQVAAWFHDTGYDQGAKGHERRSADYAIAYLKDKGFSADELSTIEGVILVTKLPQKPETLLQEIICDADLSHLGKKSYWDRCGRVRHEMAATQSRIMSELEWVDFELGFMENHSYFTEVSKDLYNKRKKKHIRQLLKQKLRLNPRASEVMPVDPEWQEEKQKKKQKYRVLENGLELKDLNLGRGVETMYRTTYRTHINLSSIADNKANIMLSINAIIVSITFSTLVPSFDDNPRLIVPTVMLLIVTLTSIVYATLSTRPKITEGKFTREDIEQKRSNLLFFGNFYNMKLGDFHWGMMEMIKDSDFLYSSMTRDLYYLGVVLAKKYRYLSICYGVFMYGLILTTIAFAVSFILIPK